jgi:hypothetical protein
MKDDGGWGGAYERWRFWVRGLMKEDGGAEGPFER